MDEPITTEEAKLHLRVDFSTDDSVIDGYIAAARDWVEGETGVALVVQEVAQRLSSFCGTVRLSGWPIIADAPITITYLDRSGTSQSITDAVIAGTTRPATLLPAVGTQWPLYANAILATYTVGYADPADIPAGLKQAMLVMLTAFYEDREGGDLFASCENAARSLCRRHKRRTL
jgi:uncharacterized phiE125 gp8 family phage protein